MKNLVSGDETSHYAAYFEVAGMCYIHGAHDSSKCALVEVRLPERLLVLQMCA